MSPPPTEPSSARSHAEILRSRIDSGEAQIGVIGLGYVGLPLSLAFVEKGFTVLGFDIDPDKVEQLGRGQCYISHLDGDRVRSAVASKRFQATADFGRLAEPDALLICVPTPLTARRDPDLHFVEGTARAIAERLRRGQLVILESTTYPGTTDELVRGILEASGLACGGDFFLAFSPEREDPGNRAWSTTTIPKVVGGVDPVSGDLAEALYAAVVTRTVRVSSARAAEATKLMENVFRAVNIALVNELKVIYDRMDIDIWEVLDAAETKPFGYMRFDPGPGLGGHCIPIDPYYLSWKAREHGISTRFIELAGEINTAMPKYVVERVVDVLNDAQKPVKGSRILVLGVAYKPNVSDDRESPSYVLMDLLQAGGAEVAYHDPHVLEIPLTREHPHWAGTRSVPWDRETIEGFDIVVIATAHQSIDYRELGEWARCIVDTRNAMGRVPTEPGKVWKA